MPRKQSKTEEAIKKAQEAAYQRNLKQRERRRTSHDWTPEEREHKMARKKKRIAAKAQGMLPPSEQRRCGKVGYTGLPCKQGRYIVWVPQGEGQLDKPMLAPTCYGHLSQGQREKYAKIQGQKDGPKKSGRERQPRVVDALREQVEAHVAEIIAPLLSALEAEKPIVVGNGAHASVELHPDHRTRILAVQEIFDRVYGKPKQTTENTHQVAFEPVEVPTDKQREEEVARILAESGALGTIVASRNPASQN